MAPRRGSKWIWYVGFLVFFIFLADWYGLSASLKAFASDRMMGPGRTLTSAGSSVAAMVGSLTRFYSMGEENRRLREANKILLQEIIALKEVQSLESFSRSVGTLFFDGSLLKISARVMGEDSLFAPSYFILDKGTEDGVQPGMAVIDEHKAYLGRIKSVTTRTARMDLANNYSNPVLVTILDRDVSGVIERGDSNSFTISFLDKRGAVVPGDLVVTSGKDGLPRGLIVGIIETIKNEEGMVFQEVRGTFMTHPREVTRLIIVGMNL